MPVQEISNIVGMSREAFLKRMKDQYLPKWDDMINEETKLLKACGKKVGTIIGGKRSLTSVLHTDSQSAGISLFENDNLPTPRAPKYEELETFPRALYCRVRVTGHAERATSGAPNDKAWAQAMKENLRSARRRHQINKNRKMYLGQRDALGVVQAQALAAATTVTLQPRSARTSDADLRYAFGAHYLEEGMSVGFVADNAGSVDAGGNPVYSMADGANELFITGIDTTGANPVVTLNAGLPAQVEANALMVPYRSRLDAITAGANEASQYANFNGLFDLITDESYNQFLYGVDRTSRGYLKGFVGENGGVLRSYDEDLITEGLDSIADNRFNKGEAPDCLFMNRSMRREHVEQIQPERRFKPVTTKRGWGKQAFSAGDNLLSIETDRDCPPGLVFMLSKKTFGWYQESPMHMPDHGERFVANKDAREIILVESGNLVCRNPAANGVIEDLSFTL